MVNYGDLGKEVYEAYTRNGFGKVLKSEIDQAVFHAFLLNTLDGSFLSDGGGIRYFHVDKTQLYRLSIRSGVTEARVKSLLEADYFRYGKSVQIEDFLLEMVNATSVRKELLQTGTIRFLVPNPIARKFIEERIFSVGGLPEYGTNREILILEVLDFLRVVHCTDDGRIAETIRRNILSLAGKKAGSPEIDAFLAELNAVPLGERLKRLAMGAAEKVMGKAGDEILGAVFELAKAPLKKS
jgi:hypothetical protein